MSIPPSFRISQLRFRNLRLLQLIEESGSIRRAARLLHITQPAASAMLGEMERALGVQLFARSRSGMSPTPAVKALLRRIAVIGNELAAIEAEAAAEASRSRQVLRLGVLPRSMQNIMPAVLTRLVERHRDLEFWLSEATSDVLFQNLARGELDGVIGRLTRETVPHDSIEGIFRWQTLYEEGMCIVAATGHPLARRRRLALADLSGCDWVLPPPGSVTRNLLVDEFLHAGLAPPVPVIQSASFLSNLSLVEQGGMITISPLSAARKYQKFQRIRILDVALQTPLPPISLIWSASRTMQGPLQMLKDELLLATGQ